MTKVQLYRIFANALLVMLSVTFAITVFVISLHAFTNFWVQSSASAPIGIWQTIETFDKAEVLERGDWVLLCPELSEEDYRILRIDVNHRTKCGRHPLLKRVSAIAGDVVVVDVTGRVTTPSDDVQAYQLTPAGEVLPAPMPGEYVVAEGEVWLINDYSMYSVDSRYYGSRQVDEIVAKAKPIWVF